MSIQPLRSYVDQDGSGVLVLTNGHRVRLPNSVTMEMVADLIQAALAAAGLSVDVHGLIRDDSKEA